MFGFGYLGFIYILHYVHISHCTCDACVRYLDWDLGVRLWTEVPVVSAPLQIRLPTILMTSSIHGDQPPSSGTEMARCPNVPPNDAPPISVWSELQSNEVACCCSYVALYPELWWLLPQDLCPHLWQATSRKPPRLVVVLPCPYRLIQPSGPTSRVDGRGRLADCGGGRSMSLMEPQSATAGRAEVLFVG